MTTKWLQATSALREQFLFSVALFDSVNQIPGALAVPLTPWRMIPAMRVCP
jgi:hypothetical protein